MGSEEVETKLLQKLIDVIINLFPVIVSTCSAGYKVYKKLPMPYVQLIIGSIICFFGGIYPTVFAALQVSNHNILYSYSICVYKRYMGTLNILCSSWPVSESIPSHTTQAAEHGGLTTVRKSLSSLTNEIMIIINQSKKDDKVDADGDGIPDAKQISGRELIKRKVKLVLTKMDPEKVNTAIASIYKGVC